MTFPLVYFSLYIVFVFATINPERLFNIRRFKREYMRKRSRDSAHYHSFKNNKFRVKLYRLNSYKMTVSNPVETVGNFFISNHNILARGLFNSGLKKIFTGPLSFDSHAHIYSDQSAWLMAKLDATLRKNIITLAKDSNALEISKSKFTVKIHTSRIKNHKDILDYGMAITYILESLNKPVNIQKSLYNNSLNDYEISFRINCLLILINEIAHYEDLEKKINNSLDQIINDIKKDKSDKPSKIAHELIVETLKNNTTLSYEITRKLIEILKLCWYYESISILQVLFLASHDNRFKKDILSAFEAFSKEILSEFLIKILDKEDDDLLIYVLRALGTCGNEDSLKDIEKFSRKTDSQVLKEEAIDTINKLRRTLDPLKKGMLSIKEIGETDGALSVSDDATDGALSIEAHDED